jgi:hypothetical protein
MVRAEQSGTEGMTFKKSYKNKGKRVRIWLCALYKEGIF